MKVVEIRYVVKYLDKYVKGVDEMVSSVIDASMWESEDALFKEFGEDALVVCKGVCEVIEVEVTVTDEFPSPKEN